MYVQYYTEDASSALSNLGRICACGSIISYGSPLAAMVCKIQCSQVSPSICDLVSVDLDWIYRETFSPRENYFKPAGQNVWQVLKALSDILILMPVIFLSS